MAVNDDPSTGSFWGESITMGFKQHMVQIPFVGT